MVYPGLAKKTFLALKGLQRRGMRTGPIGRIALAGAFCWRLIPSHDRPSQELKLPCSK